MSTPSMSTQRAGVQSPHRALQSIANPVFVEADYLWNLKMWPGTNASTWLIPETPSGDPFIIHYKTVAQRRDFRRRYSIVEIDFAEDDFPTWSYNSAWSLQGANKGFLPVNAGMPADYFGPPVIPPGSTIPVGTPQGQYQDPGGFIQPVVMTPGSSNLWDPGSPGIANAGTGSLSAFNVTFGAVQHYSIGLSKEVNFADHLQIATNRLLARPFPAFQPSRGYGEVFGEFKSGMPLDGGWHNLTDGAYQGAPYFGATDGTGTTLFTGWFWRTTEESGNPCDEIPYFHPIATQRCRFRTRDSSAPYFIARATINRMPLEGPAADGPDSLWNVTIVASGTTVPNKIYEIPWPNNDISQSDFSPSVLFKANQQTLSCGSCCFAIVGEVPSSWAARTGFSTTF